MDMEDHNQWMRAQSARARAARREMARRDGKKVDGKGGKNNVAGKGQGKGTQTYDGNCNYCKKYGHMARDCREKKADDAQKQKNVSAVDQSSVQPTWETGHGDF